MTTGLVVKSATTDVRFPTHSLPPAGGPTLEIRMLGPFQVRRHDGTDVDRSEWRTGKVSDLLRLLALRGGEPVTTQTLVTALWPESDQRHGSASLRTAASQVRRVVGGEFLERSLAGFSLRGVWVDVAEFRELAAKAHHLTGRGEIAAADAVARRADSLYRGDLTAHDEGADWVQNERRALNATYQVLLCDAAETSSALGLGRDAVDFASRAVVLDPFSERASRLLMIGHADVGELSLAFREYERCRTLLADELGIDPSPQTREVHLALLRSERRTRRQVGTARQLRVDGRNEIADTGGHCEDRSGLAESRLRTARDLVLARDLTRARRLADEAARTSAVAEVRARAVVLSWLPEILLGGAMQAREPLAQATRLAAAAGNRLLSSRIAILNCLVAHDTGAPEFAAQWAHAANNCEFEPDVNWAWLMMRIALERGDLDTARLAGRLPLATKAGPLAKQLHMLTSASLRAAQGEHGGAGADLLSLLAVMDRANHRLLLPETLARLAAEQAITEVAQAERQLARLDSTFNSQQLLPRESYLRLIAIAGINATRGRAAAAAAAAARAAEIADIHGLHSLTAGAHDLCADYTGKAQSAAAHRGFRSSLRLTLSMVAV